MSNLKTNSLKYSKKGKNILQEISNILSYINIDRKEKHFHGKCAEVFIENGNYFLNCYFCGNNLKNMEYLMLHIYQEHFKLNVPDAWEHQEEKYHISKNIEIDANKIDIISNTNVDLDSINSFTVKDTDAIYFDTNDTNVEFNEEFNNGINETSNQNSNVDIPNEPIHYRDINGEYPCSFCTRSFKKLDDIEKHFITHSTTSTIRKSDGWQDKIFNNNKINVQTENSKRQRQRNEDGTYHCEVCSRKYIHYYNYRSHFLQVHQPDLAPYKCPDCPLTYTVRHRFEIHRRTHTGEKPYKCPHCPRAFALNTNLSRHIDIHLDQKAFSCSYCDMRFRQLSSKKSHERNIHTKERPYQCELCGKAFPRSTLLKEHWKRHTNTRPFQCSICFKNFFNNNLLNIHFNIHTGEKSYDCNLCDKKFSNVNGLKAHKKLHLDTKQYQCKLCDRTFAQNAGLYGHMKVYHNSIKTMDN